MKLVVTIFCQITAEMCSKTVLAVSYTLDHEAKLSLRLNSSIAADEDKTVMNDLRNGDAGLLLATFPNVGFTLRIYLTIYTRK